MNDYQMATVYEYLDLLEGKKSQDKVDIVRKNVVKYMKTVENIRKHASNALLLESLLA